MTLIMSLMLGCGSPVTEEPAPAEPTAPAEEPAPEAQTSASLAVQAPMGPYTARLEPHPESVKLRISTAEGKRIQPSGEARMVLQGTGEAPQRLRLQPEGAAWTGAAKTGTAPGYVAVVTAELDGRTESARFTWGEQPATAAPGDDSTHRSTHSHDDDHAHGHAHGEGDAHDHDHDAAHEHEH